LSSLLEAAQLLGLKIMVVNCSSAQELDAAFSAITQLQAGALLVRDDPVFTGERAKLTTLAARHAIPTMYFLREFVTAGGLMSYGTSLADVYRLAGVYLGRILKGEKPADLPVQQPTKFELVINLKTAKALGINVPRSLLATADEVIE
jgi:putative ABC transport system substrate-binding protein